MGTYRINGDDGSSYRVDAPDAEQAYAAFQKMGGQQAPIDESAGKIRVKGPDGSSFAFPAGTSGDVISGALRNHYGAGTDSLDDIKAPEGAISHDKSGASYIANRPEIRAQRPEGGDARDTQLTLEALKQRAAGRDLGIGGRAVAPILQGVSFGLGDEAVSAARGATAAAKGGSFADEYGVTKQIQQQELDRERTEHPVRATAGEIAGSLTSGLGAVGSGATAAHFVPEAATGASRLGASLLASAADGGAMGALSGFGAGNGAADSINEGAKGAAWGMGLGAGIPLASKLGGTILAPLVNPVMSKLRPDAYADAKWLQYVRRSGSTPEDLAAALQGAERDGQGGVFTAADAMGPAGQRAMSAVARIPHDERQGLINFLDQRQAGQGRRVANTLAEGFEAPQTAQAVERRMTAARDAASNANYGAVRNDARQVDVVPALNHLDGIIGTQPGQVLAHPNDSIEGVLRTFRERLARVNPDDFQAVQRIRGDMSDAAQSAAQSGYGNRARLIGGAVRQLDAAMENASPGFRAANAEHAAASRSIDAIAEGTNAANRGRAEDTIRWLQTHPAQDRNAFRVGYADPLIEKAQGSAAGVNKARDFTSDAFRQEAPGVARTRSGYETMDRRLGRENTMFETRAQAFGGSRTADNLADSADHAAPAVGILANLLMGHVGGAARSAVHGALARMSGVSPSVAERLVPMLLERSPAAVVGNTARAQRSMLANEGRQNTLARLLTSGAVGIQSQPTEGR